MEHNHRVWLAYRADCRIRQLSPKTIQNYYESLSDASTWLSQPFETCSRADIKAYLADCLERLATSSVRTRWVSLRVFYNWMVREELIAKSPVDGIPEPKIEDNPPRIVTDSDLKALIRVCSGTSFRSRRDLALIRMMVEPGGLRRAEVLGMNLADADLDNQMAIVRGKGNKVRYIPFGSKTLQALLRYLHVRESHAQADSEALFIDRNGRLATAFTAQMLKARCMAAGIEYINPHGLRHKAADASMAAGISDLDMMTLFGWSNPKMLAVYARSNKTARAVASAREKALGDRL